MLSIYRRHAPPCPQRSRRYRRCDCPIWVQGSLGGDYVRRALDLRSWEAASNLVHEWEATGKVGELRTPSPTVTEAVEAFLKDCQARLKPPSVKKYRLFLNNHLLPFCAAHDVTKLARVSVTQLREFRASWKFAPVTQVKSLEFLRGFFRFCISAGWITTNPAAAIKPPRHELNPTLPLSEAEIQKLLKACRKWRGNGDKLRAMILLMRYSGLRISDAVTLKRAEVRAGRIFLYQEKTGTPVYVPIPPIVQKALKEIEGDGDYFFWSGRGEVKSAIEDVRRMMYAVAGLAGVPNVHFHRLRDTFAVELLLAGVSIDQVSILLGHSSMRITEKHYSPWVKARQEQLEAAVRKTWFSTAK